MTERVLACTNCATLQRGRGADGRNVLISCTRCGGLLERGHGRSIPLALACSSATLLLLLPANLATFLTTSALGVSRSSVLASSAAAMARDGWPLLGIVILLFAVVFPLIRFALLTIVLGSLQFGLRPDWLGPAFRWANKLQTWAMPDVFLLGLAVAYARLEASIHVELGVGALTFIAAAILSLFVRAALDKQAVWRRIGPGSRPIPGDAAVECTSCKLVMPGQHAGRPCVRCKARVHVRKPESIARTMALTLAAVILYIPANLYPLATLPINFRPVKYTILEGVIDLAHAGLIGLAALVFCASFLIPFLKLAGLGWCVASVLRRSDRHLRAKSRVYRVVEEIGRWSMVDPFVIGAFVPVMHYNALIYGRAEPAAVPFTAVVILTIISAKTFDPRLMWDAARSRA